MRAITLRLICFLAVASSTASLASEQRVNESLERGFKSGYGDLPVFGGPSSVAGELKSNDMIREPLFRFDDIQKGLAPWFDWKKRTYKELGLSLGLEVNWLYQRATASLGENDAFGAMYRFPGEWLAFGRGASNSGSLVYRFEYRDRQFTDIAPAVLGTEIGTASVTPGFAYAADFGPNVTELYWKQLYNDKRVGFVAGILDFSPYFDPYPFTSLGKGFIAREFLLNPTLAITGIGALGAAARGFISERFWMGGAFYDANAISGELNLDTWESGELLKHVEVGWTPSFERRRTDRVQVTYWAVDERKDAGIPAGSGWAVSISGEFADRFLPFLRAGHSDGGGGAPAESHVSAGFGMTRRYDDRISVGLAWNKPSRKTFGADLNDEYLFEISYQLQISPNVSILPDVQLVIDPANNTSKDRIWIFGLRLRLTL
jgi:porin